MVDHLDVRHGAYADSVSLMQVSRRVGDVDGVTSALIAMATELNLGVLTGMGYETPDAGPNDLVVAIERTTPRCSPRRWPSSTRRWPPAAGVPTRRGSATRPPRAPPATPQRSGDDWR